MLGFCCCADAGATTKNASNDSKPRQMLLIVLILCLRKRDECAGAHAGRPHLVTSFFAT
jgi:hypothetical protein